MPKKNFTDTNKCYITLTKKQSIAVAGLIWQPIKSIEKSRVEIKELAKQEQCEYYITNIQSNYIQCGLASKLKYKKNYIYYSAALLLINKLHDSWLGLFKLNNDHYWLVAVDNGQVVPGGDIIFSDLEQAVKYFTDFQLLFEWEHTYKTEDILLEGEIINIEEILDSIVLNNRLRLHHIDGAKNRIKGLIKTVSSLFIIGLVGTLGWQYYQNKIAEEEQAHIAALLAEQNRKREFEQGWRNSPPADLLLSKCSQLMGDFQINLAGWILTAIACNHHSVKAVYKHSSHATTNNFIKQANQLYVNQYRFKKGGFAEVELPLEIQGDRSKQNLLPISKVSNDILEILQLGYATGAIDDVLVTKEKTAKFELTSTIAPLRLIENVNLDGVVINNVIATLSEQGVLTWKISGVIYGK